MGLVAQRHGGLPGLGIELVSPALAGEFFTTEPPGKPPKQIILLSHRYFTKKTELKTGQITRSVSQTFSVMLESVCTGL